ncbi:MAG: hypothetical protein ACI9TY_000245 [Alphaproteobacteria bacterium]|jgi:hypothetical protein
MLDIHPIQAYLRSTSKKLRQENEKCQNQS